jgi:phage baseplate assembly protein W
MRGMSATTGQALEGDAHVEQSIRDVLTTPIGTRVMRRDYGSRLFELVDAPSSPQTLVAIYAATADALRRWEPRVRLRRVRLVEAAPGKLTFELNLVRVADGSAYVLEVSS